MKKLNDYKFKYYNYHLIKMAVNGIDFDIISNSAGFYGKRIDIWNAIKKRYKP